MCYLEVAAPVVVHDLISGVAVKPGMKGIAPGLPVFETLHLIPRERHIIGSEQKIALTK